MDHWGRTYLRDTYGDMAQMTQDKFLVIATPVGVYPTLSYLQSMTQTALYLKEAGVNFTIKWMFGLADLSYARNLIASDFLLHEEFTDMIWIDADMHWYPSDVLRLLNSEHDFIGGAYHKRVPGRDDDPSSWPCEPIHYKTVKDEPFKVKFTGLGFTKITRNVYEKVIMNYGDVLIKPVEGRATGTIAGAPYANEPSPFYRFFTFDGWGTTEDATFCFGYQNSGGSIWIDPTIELGHVGIYEYSGNIETLLESRRI